MQLGKWISCAIMALTVGACGGAAKPAPKVARVRAARPAPEHVDRGPASYEAEIGGLSHDDVKKKFDDLRPQLMACVEQATNRLSVVGGRVSLRMRVGRDGSLRWAYLSDSTLGDRDAERCVLETVKSQTWPKPLSGDGLAEMGFEVEPADSPGTLSSSKMTLLEKRAIKATRSCREGIRGEFRATVYVSRSGKLLSVGVTPPDQRGETASDCIAEALRGLRLGRLAVKERASKASFELR